MRECVVDSLALLSVCRTECLGLLNRISMSLFKVFVLGAFCRLISGVLSSFGNFLNYFGCLNDGFGRFSGLLKVLCSFHLFSNYGFVFVHTFSSFPKICKTRCKLFLELSHQFCELRVLNREFVRFDVTHGKAGLHVFIGIVGFSKQTKCRIRILENVSVILVFLEGLVFQDTDFHRLTEPTLVGVNSFVQLGVTTRPKNTVGNDISLLASSVGLFDFFIMNIILLRNYTIRHTKRLEAISAVFILNNHHIVTAHMIVAFVVKPQMSDYRAVVKRGEGVVCGVFPDVRKIPIFIKRTYVHFAKSELFVNRFHRLHFCVKEYCFSLHFVLLS